MTRSHFREKIREKIGDESLQAALDANARRRVQARVNALGALPDWRERRQRAHTVRAEVTEHLDDYLDQFSRRVSANGIQVHRAVDAAGAVRLVLEIAAGSRSTTISDPLLFAKSKSMLSEEIRLNPALEAAGHRVVETDLGEYIVQLRGEAPAHIITPAVHLRRHQVGQLFHEKLGIPYTEDIPTLTQTARRVLREVFLRADVGITGVNFGVVESGTLVLLTNEGNGRMCATLPPVHIALMGMERLLPALDDLGLMLSLLSRSATGQRMTVYTQLIHSPEEGQQKHLIIVDNGRSELQSSPLKEALYCIRCGACLNACPVFREIGGHAYVGRDGAKAPYPGPIGAVISPGLLGSNYSGLAQASTLCGACKEACPVDMDLPKLLLRVRAGQLPGARSEPAGQGLLGAGLNAYTRLAAHSRMFVFSQRLAGFFGRLQPPYLHFPGFTGWGLSKDLPKPAARPFRDRFIPAGEMQGDSPTEAVTLPAALTPGSTTWPAELSRDELVEIFTTEIKALGGQVYPLMVEHLTETLIRFLRERGFQRLQVWDEIPGLSSAVLAAHGFDVRQEFAPDLDAGITGALAGIAGTGTLVIPGGAGQPLTASLLPPVHITILGVEQIFSSLEQVLRLPEVARAPATVLVSGPSRTADIEMTLTIGVHGPGELHVFLVDALPGK